jgi:Ca2+-binding RTX toxin-like protein
MVGGVGNDTYYVDNVNDSVVESAGNGTDTVVSTITHTLATNVERLVLSGSADIDGAGNDLANKIVGNSGDNILKGGAGNDTLVSNGGDDYLIGGVGTDLLTGGTGNDRFVFRDLSTDRITDFTSGQDTIDLKGIDANSALTGDQSFTFIGAHAFSHTAGELHYEEVGGNTVVTADINGDGAADFTLRLDGLHTLTSHDFIL